MEEVFKLSVCWNFYEFNQLLGLFSNYEEAELARKRILTNVKGLRKKNN